MVRRVAGVVIVLGIGAGVVAAEEFQATIRAVVSFRVGKGPAQPAVSMDIKGKKSEIFVVEKRTKVLDADGKELPGGVKGKGFEKGAEVTVHRVTEGGRPYIKSIRLNKK